MASPITQQTSTQRITRAASTIFFVLVAGLFGAVFLFELAVQYYPLILDVLIQVLSFGSSFWPPALLSLACSALNACLMQDKGRSCAVWIVGLAAFNILLAAGAVSAFMDTVSPTNYQLVFVIAGCAFPTLLYVLGITYLVKE